MKKLFFLLTVTLVCAFAAVADNAPKYVFLFIGDGMGKPHVDLARMKFGLLNMDKLPVRGSVSTLNSDGKTTDSAASGTAFACGVKTKNSRLGIDAGGNWIDSCAVLAKQQGRRCAVLTTVGVNNATPAAFYAHVLKRNESKKIMEQYPDSKIDILAGSGIDGMKKDVKQEDFLSGKAYQMEQSGSAVKVDFTGNEIQVIAKDDAPFFALKSLNRPVLVYSPGVDDLAKYVKKSIELMQDSPEGFFMMAEGGHIDHGGHGNNAQYMLDELRKFDQAIGVALDFYAKHPGDTLIIVSADHHTGGLSLSDKVNLSRLDMTPDTLQISCGEDAENVILEKMAAAKLDVNDKEKGELHQAFEIKDVRKHGNTVRNTVLHIIARNAGIAWSTRGHTSDEVYLFATGKDSAQFAGNLKNSDIGAKLKKMFTSDKAVDPELFTQKNTLDTKYFSGIFPPHVKTIAVISPASSPLKPLYKEGLERVLKCGLKVKVGKHVFAPPREGTTSAPVEDRLEDFYAAWNDPEVDFILCMRGGEGCTELLNALDWSKLAPRSELYLQGYSDVTQIVCAMQSRKLGHPVAGPMVGAMACLKPQSLQQMSDIHHGKEIGPVKLTPLVAGDCRGLPLAGHLERFSRCFDTPFPPETKGRIIFLENVNGSVAKSRELLYGLLKRGVFKEAAGVVFCQFIRCGEDAEIDALFDEIAPKLGVPVYKGFPFGHSGNCYTIDFQREAVIQNGQLTFPAVSPEKQVKAMAIYYPHWHVYPRGEEWFGKNWTEWEFVKTQAPRYPGHPVPIEPLMGYYDESKPENVEKEIDLASNAGLDIFLYDWYCYDGEVIMQEALDNGFLKARNRDKMKFALMWCYHDRRNRFRAVLDDPGAELIMRAGTPDEFRKCFDIVLEKYLGRSEYYYKDGHPFFSIFNAVEFIAKMGGPEKVKALLDEADAKAVKKGLPTIHWNAMHIKSPHVPMLKAAGFDSCAAYNITCHDLPDYKARFNRGEQLFDYREVADIHRVFWQSFDNGGLMYLPTVTRGWDCSARCRNEEPFPWRAQFYPYVGIVRNNTPELFKSLLADAKKRAENDPAKPGVVIINAWNEYAEGCWLVPDKNIGDASLQAVKSVFR